MKYLYIIIAILNCNLFYTQQTYSLETNVADVPNGSYFKDLNGDFNPYIGLWKGTWNDKVVYIQFKKIVDYVSGTKYYSKDRLYGERKIINSNGIVEIDRISTFDNNQYHEFSGLNVKFSNPAQKQLYFAPGICGMTANLDVNFLNAEKTQMSLHLIYRPGYLDESCPYYNYMMQGNEPPFNFPKDIVLTKQ